jgi:basic membrane protein A
VAEGNVAPLKVGFITVGPLDDWGYNYSHNQGRLFLEATLGKQVETMIVDRVPESPAVSQVMEKMIAAGVKLIFSTSYGYMEQALLVAAKHPDVLIEQCSRLGPPGVRNVATYFGKQYESVYISGVVAGRMTKSNKIGFVASIPLPYVIQNINAFTLGARSANPKATVKVRWIYGWTDPAAEAETTNQLIKDGADILAMSLDSPVTVAKSAEKAGVMTVGYQTDVSRFAPKGWLTGQMWNWGPLYVKIAREVIEKRWAPDFYRYGLKDGCTTLSPFGKSVPKVVRDEALALKEKIINGQVAVFQGPLSDRSGQERLETGKTPDEKLLDKMKWFVPGVEGNIPRPY